MFMQPFIEAFTGYNVDTDQGMQSISDDLVTLTDDQIETIIETGEPGPLADYLEGSRVLTIEPASGWLAYMSAPGYMDRSDYGLFDTEAEAAQVLLDMVFDQDPESYDDEERAEIAELEAQAKAPVPSPSGSVFGTMNTDVELLGTSLRLEAGQRVQLTEATNQPDKGSWFARPADDKWSDGLEYGSDDSLLLTADEFTFEDRDDELKPELSSDDYQTVILRETETNGYGMKFTPDRKYRVLSLYANSVTITSQEPSEQQVGTKTINVALDEIQSIFTPAEDNPTIEDDPKPEPFANLHDMTAWLIDQVSNTRSSSSLGLILRENRNRIVQVYTDSPHYAIIDRYTFPSGTQCFRDSAGRLIRF